MSRELPDFGEPARSNQEIQIGPRLRHAREQRGLTLAQVAEFAGLTKGFISQIERDKTTVSVSSLMAICDALNIQMSTLFAPPRSYVSRATNRAPKRLIGTAIEDYLLSPPTDGRFQVLETLVAPGGGDYERPYRLQVERAFVFVLEGSVQVDIETHHFVLDEGDALTFDARTDRLSWRNSSDTESARVIWLLLYANESEFD